MATASSLLGQSCTWKVSDKAVPGGGGGSACSALGLWLLRGEGGGAWLALHPCSRPDLKTPHLPSMKGGCAGARPPLAAHPLQ